MISPFSILKLIFGSGKSSSSEGVGDGMNGGGCGYSFSSYGEGGVESDGGSANMLDNVREQDDNEEKTKDGGGGREEQLRRKQP